jgi:hypothetical protein
VWLEAGMRTRQEADMTSSASRSIEATAWKAWLVCEPGHLPALYVEGLVRASNTNLRMWLARQDVKVEEHKLYLELRVDHADGVGNSGDIYVAVNYHESSSWLSNICRIHITGAATASVPIENISAHA